MFSSPEEQRNSCRKRWEEKQPSLNPHTWFGAISHHFCDTHNGKYTTKSEYESQHMEDMNMEDDIFVQILILYLFVLHPMY